MLTVSEILAVLMDEKAKAFSSDVLYFVSDLTSSEVTFKLFYGKEEELVSEASTMEGKMTLFLLWVKSPHLFKLRTAHKEGLRDLDVDESLIWKQDYNTYYIDEALSQE